jgi:hypothetical protein
MQTAGGRHARSSSTELFIIMIVGVVLALQRRVAFIVSSHKVIAMVIVRVA